METSSALLEIEGLNVCYGSLQVLFDLHLTIGRGELVCLLGGNASGKSTTLKAILGLCRVRSGAIRLEGERIDGRPTREIVARGVAVVPENRRIFPQMSVEENLAMGAYLRRDAGGVRQDRERVLALFPRLAERLGQPGSTLSGGEQQMLAMARALMARPRLLLMDEPSMGLSPLLVDQQFELIQAVNREGTTIFMVEQNAGVALSIAHRGYVLQTGAVVLADTAANLLCNPLMQEAYLGGDTVCEEPRTPS